MTMREKIKTDKLSLRLTGAEKQQIAAGAADAGIDMSTFIRRRLAGDAPVLDASVKHTINDTYGYVRDIAADIHRLAQQSDGSPSVAVRVQMADEKLKTLNTKITYIVDSIKAGDVSGDN